MKDEDDEQAAMFLSNEEFQAQMKIEISS